MNTIFSFRGYLARTAFLVVAAISSAATVESAFAQGQLPAGTISGSGSGPYTYNITFSDGASATSPVGSVWYSWIPGQFFLPAAPTSATAPPGWTATVDSNSVQFTANNNAFFIQPGQSLSGFSYTAAFSPSQLALNPNSEESDAYSAGLFSDNGKIFFVQVVPEPSVVALAGCAAALSLFRRKQSRVR